MCPRAFTARRLCRITLQLIEAALLHFLPLPCQCSCSTACRCTAAASLPAPMRPQAFSTQCRCQVALQLRYFLLLHCSCSTCCHCSASAAASLAAVATPVQLLHFLPLRPAPRPCGAPRDCSIARYCTDCFRNVFFSCEEQRKAAEESQQADRTANAVGTRYPIL